MVAPRDKNRVTTHNSYNEYLEITNNPISLTIYRDIINQFFKFIISLVFQGEHVKLPFRSGSVLITGVKVKPRMEDGEIKGLAPNWAKTKALWERNPKAKEEKKVIYNFNEHTGGVRYKITWVKKDVMIENKLLYSLIFSKANKREMSRLIFSGKEYIVIR